jgi:serine phosphatase RsbU (regulator of sigma subunit)
MDGILICFDLQPNINAVDSLKISYAASNNGPVLVKSNDIKLLPKDKMPVGKGERMNSFSLFSIDLEKGDSFYLYTDGYADQFGGEKGKKFKYKSLNQLLVEVNPLPLVKQHDVLTKTFDSWKGNLEQVDDVLIIGIKI